MVIKNLVSMSLAGVLLSISALSMAESLSKHPITIEVHHIGLEIKGIDGIYVPVVNGKGKRYSNKRISSDSGVYTVSAGGLYDQIINEKTYFELIPSAGSGYGDNIQCSLASPVSSINPKATIVSVNVVKDVDYAKPYCNVETN